MVFFEEDGVTGSWIFPQTGIFPPCKGSNVHTVFFNCPVSRFEKHKSSGEPTFTTGGL